jgi:hypothetical protein
MNEWLPLRRLLTGFLLRFGREHHHKHRDAPPKAVAEAVENAQPVNSRHVTSLSFHCRLGEAIRRYKRQDAAEAGCRRLSRRYDIFQPQRDNREKTLAFPGSLRHDAPAFI